MLPCHTRSKDVFSVYQLTEQDREQAHQLVLRLNELWKSKSKQIKRTEFTHQATGIVLSSWRMNERDYKKKKAPTMARGLFSRLVGDKYEIVVRGYDKFFNVDEVHETKWDNIEADTVGPYEITVKENGCIIFIGGLPGGHLVVTSKHSMGAREDTPVSHAQKGEEWLYKNLEKVGKSKKQLATYLHEHKLTAVSELCDDSFEEHVLPYGSGQRGLYLHGVNYNTIHMRTWPSDRVSAFASEWGFIPTNYYVKDTVQEVTQFTDEIKKTGVLDDRPIEGFVIRAKIKDIDRDYFFKIKCDEMYLMYREWREITKVVLGGKRQPRVTFALSKQYLEWVKEKIKKEPGLFKEYSRGHGIFKVRDMFLEHLDKQGASQSGSKTNKKHDTFKTLVVAMEKMDLGKDLFVA